MKDDIEFPENTDHVCGVNTCGSIAEGGCTGMRDSIEIIIKNGRVWCVKHEKPWKECPCEGQMSGKFPITKEIMDHVTGEAGAYEKAAEAAFGQV